MVIYATAIRVGGQITTDAIASPAARADGDPATLAAACLAAVDPSVAERARDGDVLVVDGTLGHGPDPDLAALALQAAGLVAVLCAAAAPSFVAAAHAVALPVIETPGAAAVPDGAVLRIDLAAGRVEDRATGAGFSFTPPPAEVLAAARRAEVLRQMRRVVEEEGYDG